MNHKSWLWRKRSMEKTIFAVDKFVNPPRTTKEMHELPKNKEAGLERSSKSLNEKLASVLLGCDADDNPLAKHEHNSPEETRGKEKERQEVESLEEEADEELGKEASAERLIPRDSTLQDSSQQLSCVQEEQEQRMCGAVPRISIDHEKIQKELEEKLRETSKRLADLTIENTCLTNALLAKEKSIGDLLKCKRQTDAEFSTLMARLDSSEKENAFLRYEFHMLEKELEIQKEEMDYSRQYADASHKQYLESVEKVSKLEAECQRLGLLVQRRSPGPANLVNMKNKVGTTKREADMTRRKSNPTRDLIYSNTAIGNSPEVSGKTISLMMKRLQDLDEENKALKRILTKKNTELESSRIMYAQTASRLSQAEILLRKLSEDYKSMKLARCSSASNELSIISKFDIASDDDVSCSGSWATALISELEHLRTREVKNQKNNISIEVRDLSLLDDFVEMEKRPIVSIDTPKKVYCSDLTGTELVPVEQDIGFSESKQEMQFNYATSEESFDWVQIVLNEILKQKRISKRSLDELFVDIKIALGSINHPTACESDTTQKSRHLGEIDSFDVNGINGVAEEKSNQLSNSNTSLGKSIQRIIKLIEGIAPSSFICDDCPNDCLEKNQHSNISQAPTSKECIVHVFQWKVSELNPLLHQLVHTCKDLITGRADFEKFTEEVACALDWSVNNCTNPTNASITRDKIKKHISFHLSENDNESQLGVDVEQSFHLPLDASPDDQSVLFNMKNDQYDLLEENRKLEGELRNAEFAKQNLEAKLLLVTNESQDLMKQLQEAHNSIKSLQSELETQKEFKLLIENQIEKQKLINEDLDTQLTIAHAKLSDIFQKFSSLEVELEDKKTSCEELEATCLELQLQLESIAKKESPTCGRHEVEKIYKTGWEITTASSKLAECQETILNLGRQLRALASSSEAALFDRIPSARSAVTNSTHKKNLIKRASLRSQMQAEDDAKGGIIKSAQIEENQTTRDVQKPSLVQPDKDNALQPSATIVNATEGNLTSEKNDRSNATGARAIVPSKKQWGFGFLRKLLLTRKRGKGKGTQFLAKA